MRQETVSIPSPSNGVEGEDGGKKKFMLNPSLQLSPYSSLMGREGRRRRVFQ